MAIVRIPSSKIDKLRELMRKLFVFIATGLLSLLTVNNSSYAEQSASQFSVLDMSQFSSAVEAKAAFDAVYRKGSNVCPVVKYLEANANRNSSPFELYDFTFWGWVQETAHKYNLFVKDDGFFVQVPRPDENMDVWRINILHSGCRLVEAKFRLQYRDKNFAKRGVPFRFEYFEDTNLIGTTAGHYALISIAETESDSLEYIRSILEGAGAKYHGRYNAGTGNYGGGMYGFTYVNKTRNLASCKSWSVSVDLDEFGKIARRNGTIVGISLLPPHCTTL